MERRLNKPSSEASDGANNQGTTGAQPATKEVKTKGHIVIPTHEVFVKVSRRSMVGMAYRPTSKVVRPSELTSLHQGQRPYGQQKWGHLLVPMW